eukprot:Gb_01056 [translate_table: standard]
MTSMQNGCKTSGSSKSIGDPWRRVHSELHAFGGNAACILLCNPCETFILYRQIALIAHLKQKQGNAVPKSLVHLKSTKNPEQVLAFFKELYFTNAHIQKMVARCPILLTSSVHNTLQPKLRGCIEHCREAWDSTPLRNVSSCCICCEFYEQDDTLEHKIKFLMGLGVSEEEVLLSFRKSPYIQKAASEKKLQYNMDFLLNTLKCEPSLIWSSMNMIDILEIGEGDSQIGSRVQIQMRMAAAKKTIGNSPRGHPRFKYEVSHTNPI